MRKRCWRKNAALVAVFVAGIAFIALCILMCVGRYQVLRPLIGDNWWMVFFIG